MKIFLVGGAVRDELLGLPVKEKDWVVVGATVAEMLKEGYRQVGKDFPVFLHPKTQEEYALARVERKVSAGYTGFEFDTSPQVTLEEDLLRRDLTINAIAKNPDGTLIDPYHGQADLNKKILRHVSPAFSEDPVRILRVARFAARFAKLGFTVAPETLTLMQDMVKSGEVNALVAERVWKELERGLQEKNPAQFFQVLSACGALSILFPDIKPENIAALERAAPITTDGEIRFAVLCYNLSDAKINDLCARYRVPSMYRALALLVAEYYSEFKDAENISPKALLLLLQHTDAFRRPERFKKFLEAGEILSGTDRQYNYLEKVFNVANNVDYKSSLDPNLTGKDIADHIAEKRIEAIKQLPPQPH